MIVGFDIDGVLYPWHKEIHKWYKGNYNPDMSYEEFWDSPGGFVYTNEGTTIIKNLVYLPFIYENVRVGSNVIAAVSEIHDKCDDIHYITARPSHVHRITRNWLKECGFVKAENILFADNFEGGKLEAIKMTGCTHYVEDRRNYATEISEHIPVFLVTTPYNKNYDFNRNVTRVNSVRDIPEHLE